MHTPDRENTYHGIWIIVMMTLAVKALSVISRHEKLDRDIKIMVNVDIYEYRAAKRLLKNIKDYVLPLLLSTTRSVCSRCHVCSKHQK